MDVASLASAFIGSQTAQTQMAVAAKMVKMNAEAEASVVTMIEAAQQNLASLANVANGVGGNLDISA